MKHENVEWPVGLRGPYVAQAESAITRLSTNSKGQPEREITIADRARFAREVLRAYNEIRGYGLAGAPGSSTEEDVIDLLTDLRHLCRGRINFGKARKQSNAHYLAETQERGGR